METGSKKKAHLKSAFLRPLTPLPEDPLATPKERQFNEISRSKTCPACGSTNAAGNAKCDNCGNSLAGLPMTYHQHAPSPKGEQGKGRMSVNPSQRVAQIVPQQVVNPITTSPAQATPPQSASPPAQVPVAVKKPMPTKQPFMISDEDAERTDRNHLDNVDASANALGI